MLLWCQDFSLGGWLLERSVDGDPAIVYKFTPKYVLKSGSYVTVSSGVIIIVLWIMQLFFFNAEKCNIAFC